MPHRLVQIVVPAIREVDAEELLEELEPAGRWRLVDPEGGELIQLVVPAEGAETLMDRFAERFATSRGFRMTLLPVEAAVPTTEEEPPAEAPSERSDPAPEEGPPRIGREELRADAMDAARLTSVHLAMVAASTVVAAVGVLRNDVTVIIGAMVIAPLLGPNVALALAATLADTALARRAAVTGLAGLTVALGLSVAVGALVTVDPTVDAIASRTRPATSDVVLALAAGTAGAFAFTSGFPQAVIGVMVAVALLPPLVIFGLLLGAGLPALAVGAFLLLALNVVCVNLAGVATFLVQGVRPAGWWEARRARTTVRRAVLVWATLLVVLAAVLWASRWRGFGPFANP
jgi:uncharacterized hydrophobic protein (TIGR00341 family)